MVSSISLTSSRSSSIDITARISAAILVILSCNNFCISPIYCPLRDTTRALAGRIHIKPKIVVGAEPDIRKACGCQLETAHGHARRPVVMTCPASFDSWTLTRAVPSMPMLMSGYVRKINAAAANDGPWSLMRSATVRRLARLVTVTVEPNQRVRCAAVSACVLKRSPDAVRRPW